MKQPRGLIQEIFLIVLALAIVQLVWGVDIASYVQQAIDWIKG